MALPGPDPGSGYVPLEPKKKKQPPDIETPEQYHAYMQSHAVHELNTRISAFAPGFVADHPQVVAHSVFSTMSTPKLQALGPYLSQSWENLKSTNAYAGVSGALIRARSDAVAEQEPQARAMKLFLLQLLAEQAPDEQVATAAKIRDASFRQSYEAGFDPTATPRQAYEAGGPQAVARLVASRSPQAAQEYQRYLDRYAAARAGGFWTPFHDIWQVMLRTQRQVFGVPEPQAQEDKVIRTAREKLAAIGAGPGNLAVALKGRGLSQPEITEALKGQREAANHVQAIADALIEARRDAPGGALGGAVTAANTQSAARAGAVPVGSVKVAWQSTGNVEIQTDDTKSPDAKLTQAVAQTLFPGTAVSYIGRSGIEQAIAATTDAVNKGMQYAFSPVAALSKITPITRDLLEMPANFLAHVGSDVSGTIAKGLGVSPTDPLYTQMENIGALLVQLEGLKGIGKLGEAVKLGRSGPREVTMPGVRPTLAARLLKPSLSGVGSATAEVRAAAEAQGVGRLDINPESIPFMGTQLGRVTSAVADYLGRPRISDTEALLTRRLGGPLIGRVARTVADLVSKPKEEWFDSGVGGRRVTQIDKLNERARAAGHDPAGDILEWSKNTVDPNLARELADSQTKQEVRDTLVRWSTRIDQEHLADLRTQDTRLSTELKRTDLNPDERSSLLIQRQDIRAELDQTNPDRIMWEVPKSSGLHRVINRIPNTRLGSVLGALADPQVAIGLGKAVETEAKRPPALNGAERGELFNLSAAQDIRKLSETEQARLDELAQKQQAVWNWRPPEFKGRKTFRISTLRPFMDDMPRNVLYPPSMLGYGAEQAAHNVAWLSKALRRIGVHPDIIRSVLSDMTKLGPGDYAGSFQWMKRVAAAVDSSPHLAPDLKAALTNFFARQETERSFGWYTDPTGGQSPVLVDSATGTALPTMPTELLRNPIPMFSHDLAIEATSFTRYWVRRARYAGYEQVIEKGQKVEKPRRTAGGLVARTAMLPYKLSKFIMWASTAVFKPLILVSRTLGALPLRIQGEQWFRNYFAGARGFAREAMFGREEAFPVPFNALGGIVRDTLTPMEGTRSVYPTTDTGQFRPGDKLPQDVRDGVWRRLKMFGEDPVARTLATLGPEEFQTWFESPAARPYFEAMKPLIEASDAGTVAEYAKRKYAEVSEVTNGNPRIIDALATGTFKDRGSLVSDQIANQMSDRTLAQEYSTLETEYLTVMDRVQEELRGGNTAAVQGLQGRLEEIMARQQGIEDSITQLPAESMYRPITPFDPAANDIALDDQAAWTAEGGLIDRMFNDGEYRLPRTVTTEKTVVDQTTGRLQGIRDGISTLSQVMYRGLKPTSFFDRHGTRGAFYYQAYAARFAEAVSRGLEPDVARFEAMHKAATQTSDHLYDLSVRSSVHKFLANTFWFAPAYQEILTTWLWKLPSRGYWPLGMAWILGDAHALLQFAHNEGWIHSIPSKDPKTGKPTTKEILNFPFLRPLFERLMPPGHDLGDAGKDQSIIYGYPSGANIVSSGLPGISSVPSEAIGVFARKYGGMWKSLSDVLLPYGMDVSVGPGALNYGWMAATGEKPPWEVFSSDYQQQVHDLAFDDSLAMAYHKLQSEGVKPPQLSDYPDSDAGHKAYRQAMYGTGGWLQKWRNEAHSIFKGRALVRMVGASISPISLHITDTYRQAVDQIWQKVTGGKPYDSLTPAQKQDVQTHLNSWVAGHPYSGAYAVARTAAGDPTRTLPYSDTGTTQFYDQFYTGQRKVLSPEDYQLTVMAHESYRQFSGQIQGALKGISPTLNWRVILTQGYKKREALTPIQDRIANWRLANPKAWGIIQQNSQTWAAQKNTPVKTFEAQRLSQFYADFGHFAKLFTVQGITDKAYKAEWGRIGGLFSSDAQVGGVALGAPTTPLEKHIDRYRVWVKPYYDQLHTLYTRAAVLRANHLDPSQVYTQARRVTNEWAEKAKLGVPRRSLSIYVADPKLRQWAKDAAKQWNAVAGGSLIAITDAPGAAKRIEWGHTDVVTVSGEGGTDIGEAQGEAFDWGASISRANYAVVQRAAKKYNWSPSEIPATMIGVIAHEMGHILGLSHDAGPGKPYRGGEIIPSSIMAGGSSTPTNLDLTDLRKLNPSLFQTMPQPEAVSWGNLSVHEQRLARYHWAVQPVSWLTDFQRQRTGYHGSEGRKYDAMFNQLAAVNAKVDAYVKKLHKEASDPNITIPTKYFDLIQKSVHDQLVRQVEKGWGKEGLRLFNLDGAAPYVRLNYLHVGDDNQLWAAVGKAVDAITRKAVKHGDSPSGNSALMDYYRQSLFPLIADWANPRTRQENAKVFAKQYNMPEDVALQQLKGFANLLDELNLSTRSTTNPIGLLGPALYDAVFFNQFKTQFTPDHPKAFLDLAGSQGSQYIKQQQQSLSGNYQTAQGLAVRAAQASGVPEATKWAGDSRLWYILEHEPVPGIYPTSTPREVQQAATSQNPHSTAFGLGQFLDTTWATVGATKTSDPYTQMVLFFKYIKHHWGSLEAAYQHKKVFGNY